MIAFTYTLALMFCIALFIGNKQWWKQVELGCR